MIKGSIIGLGRMGLTHFSILNTHPLVKIISVCDASKVMLNLFKKYMQGIETFSDYKDLINSKPDFVVISTPGASHAEIVKFALNNNIHTFVEKPLALNASQGKDILETLNDKKLANQVGYVYRFNEVFMEVKKLINNNILGNIKYFIAEFHGPTMLKDVKSSWRKKKTLGGGCLYELASHCIDLVIYLFGQPNNIGECVLQSIYSSDVEDLISATLLYDNFFGKTISNWSDYSFRKPSLSINIFGTKGKILADQYSYKLFLKYDTNLDNFHQGWNSRYITDLAKGVRFYVRGNEFTNQLDYFIDQIDKGLPDNNISSFSEAYKTDLVIENIFKNALLM